MGFSVRFSLYLYSFFFVRQKIVNFKLKIVFKKTDKNEAISPLSLPNFNRHYFPLRIVSPSTQCCAQVEKPSIRRFHCVHLCLAIALAEQFERTTLYSQLFFDNVRTQFRVFFSIFSFYRKILSIRSTFSTLNKFFKKIIENKINLAKKKLIQTKLTFK